MTEYGSDRPEATGSSREPVRHGSLGRLPLGIIVGALLGFEFLILAPALYTLATRLNVRTFTSSLSLPSAFVGLCPGAVVGGLAWSRRLPPRRLLVASGLVFAVSTAVVLGLAYTFFVLLRTGPALAPDQRAAETQHFLTAAVVGPPLAAAIGVLVGAICGFIEKNMRAPDDWAS